MLVNETEINVPYDERTFTSNYIQFQIDKEKQIIEDNKLSSYTTKI